MKRISVGVRIPSNLTPELRQRDVGHSLTAPPGAQYASLHSQPASQPPILRMTGQNITAHVSNHHHDLYFELKVV